MCIRDSHKPVVIQDQVLGELTLNKDYDTFEGEIQWCGKDVSLSLEMCIRDRLIFSSWWDKVNLN